MEDIISDKIEEFSDDDMIPLAELATKLNVNKFVWKKCVSNYLAPANFCEDFGPTCIPPEVETPVEVFSCLFPDTLFEQITLKRIYMLHRPVQNLENHSHPLTFNKSSVFLP